MRDTPNMLQENGPSETVNPNAELRTTITQITLDLPLQPSQIPQFRGAIAAHAGRQNERFHNHDNAAGNFHYRYPLIQYQTVAGKATLLGIAAGAEALNEWEATYTGQLQMQGRWHKAPILAHSYETVELGFTAHSQTYRIQDWVALNDAKYKQWKDSPRLIDKLAIFEKSIVGHILSFARSIDWHLEQQLVAEISEISSPEWRKHKSIDLLVFDATVRLPLSLPEGIGMGKSASLGFGRIVHHKGAILS